MAPGPARLDAHRFSFGSALVGLRGARPRARTDTSGRDVCLFICQETVMGEAKPN